MLTWYSSDQNDEYEINVIEICLEFGLFQFVAPVMAGIFPPPIPSLSLITQGVVGVGRPVHTVYLSTHVRPAP